MPETMLVQSLGAAPTTAIQTLLDVGLSAVNKLKSMHEAAEVEPMLAALFNLAKSPEVGQAVAAACRLGAASNARLRDTGNIMAAWTIFAPLLRLTPLSPELESVLVREAYGSDPRTQKAREAVALLQRKVIDCVERLEQVLHELIRAGLKSSTAGREDVLGWLASLVGVAEVRLRVKDHTAPPAVQGAIFAGHGPALNFSRLLLLLAEPFVRNAEKLAAVDAAYFVLSNRLVCEDVRVLSLRKKQADEDLAAVRGIMETEGVDEAIARELHQAMQLSMRDTEVMFNLVTEMFFTTLRALHCCLLPAVDGFGQLMASMQHSIAGVQPGTPDHAAKELQLISAHDRWGMALLEPMFVDSITRFYLAAAHWLHSRLEADVSNDCLQTVPDFVVKDIAIWISYIARHSASAMRPPAVSRASLSPLIAMTATLLHRSHLFPGPIVSSKLIAMLRALIETGGNSSGRSGPLAHDGPLAYEVIDHNVTQRFLGPALLRSYVAVDMVEGLDVDKEEFDKYSVKHDMACLLKRVWVSAPHRAAILAEVGSPAMENFAQSLLEMLLFVSGGAFDSLRYDPFWFQ